MVCSEPQPKTLNADGSTSVSFLSMEFIESSAFYRQLVERMQEGLLVVDNDDVIIYVNPMFCNLLGYELWELRGRKGYETLLLPKDRERILQKNLERQEGISDDYEIPMLPKGKSEPLMFHLKASPITDSKGNVIGSMAICLDVTETRKAQMKIQSLLKQKEVLLREVHHRIKNHMSTIRSLLALHSYSINEVAAIAALDDAQHRVMSMMTIYDKLYRSDDFVNIAANEYLADLVSSIHHTYKDISNVQIYEDYGDNLLAAELMFNIGIIVTELLTNSFKYAFKDMDKGIISISLKQFGDEKLCLVYSDNGCGIPQRVLDSSRNSFGMNLIEILVNQISGKLSINSVNGTMYKIEF